MSYSFTEPVNETSRSDSESSTTPVEHKLSPVMVPMADILNHVAKNNARLDFGVESLKMVATRPIAEVFNSLLLLLIINHYWIIPGRTAFPRT